MSSFPKKSPPKGVVVAIIGCLELDIHQIHSGRGRRDKEELHHRVVQRDEVGQQVQVTGYKHNQKQNLKKEVELVSILNLILYYTQD